MKVKLGWLGALLGGVASAVTGQEWGQIGAG